MAAPRFLSDLAGTLRSQFRIKPAGALGAPTNGAHLIGEEHVDSAGARWYCTVSGTPGTWQGGSVAVPLGNGVNQLAEAVALTVSTAMTWDVALVKGANVQYSRVSVVTDLSTAQYNQSGIVESGTGIPVVHVDLVAGPALHLLVDTSSTGWTATIRRYTAA